MTPSPASLEDLSLSDEVKEICAQAYLPLLLFDMKAVSSLEDLRPSLSEICASLPAAGCLVFFSKPGDSEDSAWLFDALVAYQDLNLWVLLEHDLQSLMFLLERATLLLCAPETEWLHEALKIGLPIITERSFFPEALHAQLLNWDAFAQFAASGWSGQETNSSRAVRYFDWLMTQVQDPHQHYLLQIERANIQARDCPPVRRDAVAFLCAGPIHLSHYRSIFEAMPPEDFVILTFRPIGEQYRESMLYLKAYCQERGWSLDYIQDMLAGGYSYRAFVHFWEEPVMYTPYFKAALHIRYLLHGFEYHAFGDRVDGFKNECFSIFLCQGPHLYQVLEQFSVPNPQALRLQTGYPRFDDYFTRDFDRDAILARLGLNPELKTVVYTPTHGSYSTLEAFAPTALQLGKEYNLICKLHPNSLLEFPEIIAQLDSCALILTQTEDESELFAIADWILADYGGSMLIGVYLDIPTLLLNKVEEEPYALSSLLRKKLHNFEPEDYEQIPELLKQAEIWAEQIPERKRLREHYFAAYYGYAGKMIASVFANLDTIERTMKKEASQL